MAGLKDSGELPRRVTVRSSKYLNNLIEQDHPRVKQRLRPMLGLERFATAAVVIGGIELAEKISPPFSISRTLTPYGRFWVTAEALSA